MATPNTTAEFLAEQNADLQSEINDLYRDLREMENRVMAVKSRILETADMVTFHQVSVAVDETDLLMRRSAIKMVRRRTVDMESAKLAANMAADGILAARRKLSELMCETFTAE